MLSLATIASLCTVLKAAPSSDLITNLPGLNFNINYKQYSGYLNLSSGHHLHYWFTESQSNPSTDPIVLWLNGGPGCSSLDGLLYEQGPIHVYDNATLYANPYAWNQNASVLFLEAPICVGFSYQDDATVCQTSDNQTANDNYMALLKFFEEFSEYQSNKFYVTGESYGGVYVPTLTRRILQGNVNNEGAKINLVAFAVGNGVTNYDTMDEGLQWFYYHHGFFSEAEWDNMQTHCCNAPYTRQNCDFSGGSLQCREAVNAANAKCCSHLNGYNIYGDCYADGMSAEKKRELDESNQLYAWDKYLRHMQYHYGVESEQYQALQGVPPCLDAKGATTYLNEEEVKKAIHVETSIEWSICSNRIEYTRQYFDLAPVYQDIFAMDSSIYATVYNGDTDTACNFLGDQWFVDDLGLNATNSWREWYVSDENGQQVGGWTKDFDRIHFVTVRGSGHMVPQYRPRAALVMFNAFIANKDL